MGISLLLLHLTVSIFKKIIPTCFIDDLRSKLDLIADGEKTLNPSAREGPSKSSLALPLNPPALYSFLISFSRGFFVFDRFIFEDNMEHKDIMGKGWTNATGTVRERGSSPTVH